MEQNRMENDTGRFRLAYVPPLTEVYECDVHQMMTQSYEMGGAPGSGGVALRIASVMILLPMMSLSFVLQKG